MPVEMTDEQKKPLDELANEVNAKLSELRADIENKNGLIANLQAMGHGGGPTSEDCAAYLKSLIRF